LFEAAITLPDAVKWCEKQSKYIGKNFWLAEYAWTAFNAALDAVVIHMPECDPGEVIQYGFAVEDFRESIQSTGLGLKVLP
jgi:hypothetical protein